MEDVLEGPCSEPPCLRVVSKWLRVTWEPRNRPLVPRFYAAKVTLKVVLHNGDEKTVLRNQRWLPQGSLNGALQVFLMSVTPH